MRLNLVPKILTEGISNVFGIKDRAISKEHLEGFSKAQEIAFAATEYTAKLIQPGWTERQATKVMLTYLKDHGIKQFSQQPSAWFAERTKLKDVRGPNYLMPKPTDRVLQENEVFILNAAPKVDGYISEVAHSGVLGKNMAYDKAKTFLLELHAWLPTLFKDGSNSNDIKNAVDERIQKAGYDNIHKNSSFSGLGKRFYKPKITTKTIASINFGIRSPLKIIRQVAKNNLLSREGLSDIRGLWAIMPHIGTRDFGVKFEELLYVGEHGTHWLSQRESRSIDTSESKDQSA